MDRVIAITTLVLLFLAIGTCVLIMVSALFNAQVEITTKPPRPVVVNLNRLVESVNINAPQDLTDEQRMKLIIKTILDIEKETECKA